jgi:hypothetical protein
MPRFTYKNRGAVMNMVMGMIMGITTINMGTSMNMDVAMSRDIITDTNVELKTGMLIAK